MKRGLGGCDAVKKINVRKRHIVTYTDGFVVELIVHQADIQDRDVAKLFCEKMQPNAERLKLLWGGGYKGALIDCFKANCVWTLEIFTRPKAQKGITVLPGRLLVERTFGWLGIYRGMSNAYEYDPLTSEVMIFLCMSRLMFKRIDSI